MKRYFTALMLTCAFATCCFAQVTVSLSSPTSGSSVTSPVKVSAQGSSSHTITAWRIYVDGVTVYKAGSASSISTNLSLAAASHKIIVRAWASNGSYGSASATFTVASSSGVSVSLTPTSTTIKAGSGQTQMFTASVSGASNTGVTWSLSGIGGLSYSGNTAVYTPPTTGSGTATLQATSIADTTKSASANISVSPASTTIGVSISPSSATLQASGTQQFTATVSGTSNTGVNWLVNGTPGGSSSTGTISSTGLYTAPGCSSVSGVTVTAVSTYDNTAKADGSVTLSSTSSSTERYVSTNGSDSNDGSGCRPWATIQHAAASVSAGQSVNILPGTYNLSGTIHMSRGGSFSNGACTNRVVFRGTSYDKSSRSWDAKLVANNFQAISIDTACVDVVGLDISVMNSNTAGYPAVKMNYNGNRVMSNHVHGALGTCVLGGGASFYDTVDGNQIDHCGAQDHSSNLDHGVYLTGNYETVTNNVVFNNSAYCIVLYNSTAGEPQYGTISSNTVWGCKYGIGVNGPTANDYVANNIIRNNLNDGINFTSNGSGNACTNNLIYNSGTAYGSNLSCSNTKSSDPLMVNFQADGSGDYHLQSVSPAIGAGTSNKAPSKDFDGTHRPSGSGYDMGAYQHP